MDPGAISTLLTDAGPYVLIIVSLMAGWLIPKFSHNDRIDDLKTQFNERIVELTKDRDAWKAQAQRVTHVAESTVTIAEKTT